MIKIIILIFILALLMSSCAAPEDAPRQISATEAREMLQDASIVLLDVRTDSEFRQSHIPGAILIPTHELHTRATIEIPNKNTVIIVYCQSGRRSAAAAADLVAMGFVNVYDMGGIIDWPYETKSYQ